MYLQLLFCVGENVRLAYQIISLVGTFDNYLSKLISTNLLETKSWPSAFWSECCPLKRSPFLFTIVSKQPFLLSSLFNLSAHLFKMHSEFG